jgi:hypothetical protein
MKQKILLITALVLMLTYGCKTEQIDTDLLKNKEVAVVYHKLNPADIDAILSDNFIGRNEKSRHTWNRDDHRTYLSNGDFKVDTIFSQVAERDWVATRFARKFILNGDTVMFEAMHFKRFENGKIAEIWEYGDTQQ